MKKLLLPLLLVSSAVLAADAPSNLVVDGIPPIPPQLVERTRPYLDARSAGFSDWNPARPEMLIVTRFADTPQLHMVKMPGGDRRQLTFFEDRVGGGRFRPNDPNTIVFSKDVGGSENFQLYRLDVPSGAITLLTDGKSRNTGSIFSRDGKLLGFESNRRNGKDLDIYLMDPMQPASARVALQVEGGGWNLTDISPDLSQLLVINRTSADESQIFLVDAKSGTKKALTKADASYAAAHFAPDGQDVYYVTNAGAEFHHLVRMNLATGATRTLNNEQWEVEDADISDDGTKIAYVTNENGISVLHLLDAKTLAPIKLPKLPVGVLGNVRWHSNGKLLGFSISSAQSPADAYSLDIATGQLTRWTESETGGLNPARNVEPQLVTVKSFDGTNISAFVYRPDPARWPGKRPVLLNIHGGPEGQSRPNFLGRTNYWINELGLAVVYPNVRGSTGYGKTYLALDNGYKREDSVKDIGALLDWIAKDPALDSARVGVYGGSYGGYMTLATMTHYNDRMRAAIDVVGISNFLTFMQNTSDYRRDLRRVEYGDERDTKMHDFLQQISPMTSAAKITKPLMVVAGFNDPRVPWTEGEQMVKTVRSSGAPVWWLMAKDEGHGFAKKKNADYQFLAMTMFLEQYLVGNGAPPTPAPTGR